jgi:hypothetical protein
LIPGQRTKNLGMAKKRKEKKNAGS